MPVATVLREVGIKPGGAWMLAEGADAAGHDRSIPVEKAMADGLLAYAANGEALRPSQGYPVRLLLPGFEGNTNVKWLRRLEVGDAPWHTRQETSHYTDLMPDGTAREFTFVMEAKSVITFPSGGQRIPGPGFWEITGLAWSGRGRIDPGRRLDRRRRHLDRGDAAGAGPADRLDPLPLPLDLGRPTGPPAEPGGRRDGLRPADAGPTGRGAGRQLLLPLQRDHDLGRRRRRGGDQCLRLRRALRLRPTGQRRGDRRLGHRRASRTGPGCRRGAAASSRGRSSSPGSAPSATARKGEGTERRPPLVGGQGTLGHRRAGQDGRQLLAVRPGPLRLHPPGDAGRQPRSR